MAAALVIFTALAAQRTPAANLDVLQLRPNFYMIAGAGGNIGFQVGVDGVVVVDSGSAASADAVVAAIKKVTTQPIRYVINTSADADHVGGNATVAKAGQTLFTGNGGAGLATNFLGGGASILSVEQVLTRMSGPSGKPSPFPVDAWPTETFNQPRKYMYLNGEGIEVFHQPAAHTDGDAIVFFRRSDVVVAGDVFDTTRFPVIDVAKGGSIQGEIAALQKLVDTAIPSVPIVSREEGTLIIPGPRPPLRSTRRCGIPRHGNDHPGPRPRFDETGPHAGTDQESLAGPGIRAPLWIRHRLVDHERFRRSGVSQHEVRNAQ